MKRCPVTLEWDIDDPTIGIIIVRICRERRLVADFKALVTPFASLIKRVASGSPVPKGMMRIPFKVCDGCQKQFADAVEHFCDEHPEALMWAE